MRLQSALRPRESGRRWESLCNALVAFLARFGRTKGLENGKKNGGREEEQMEKLNLTRAKILAKFY